MTTPHADWSKTLEWIEKQAHDSLKARFATAEIIAKEAQTTLTVLLAGIGGSAVYAARIFEGGHPGSIEIAAAFACGYFVALAVILVVACMMFKSYPALYQNPENLMQPIYSLDDLRGAELENLGERIKDATAINAKRAKHLNEIRIAIALSPIVFATAASLAPTKPLPALQKAKLICKAAQPASGSIEIKLECDSSK